MSVLLASHKLEICLGHHHRGLKQRRVLVENLDEAPIEWLDREAVCQNVAGLSDSDGTYGGQLK